MNYDPNGAGNPFAKWFAKLDRLAHLPSDWSGGRTPAHNLRAVAEAGRFLALLEQGGREPHTILASVVGGVGISLRNSGHKVYAEFHNKGVTFLLFSDGRSRPEVTEIVPDDYSREIERALVYLGEPHSAHPPGSGR